MISLKAITILLAFTTLAAVGAQNTAIESSWNIIQCNNSARIDDYVNLNRKQNAQNILNFDNQLEAFRVSYTERLDTINIQKDWLLDSLMQLSEYLNPLEVLSDFSKNCVNTYRPAVPTLASAKSTIESCIATATNQLNNLLSSPTVTRRNVQNYYSSTFENSLRNCAQRHVNSTLNNTICITQVVASTNVFTISSQKTFDTQLDATRCSANANVKRALDCSFTAQNRTIALITEARNSINRCLQSYNDAPKRYSCDEGYFLPRSQIHYNNRTMINPLYGHNNYTSDCLTMILY